MSPFSAKPDKVLKTVDAGLDMLSTCDANALKKAVVTTEKATAQAISAGELIPDDATIDEVVDAAASVAATCNAGALSTFAKTATDAATSIDGKLMGLTAELSESRLKSDKAVGRRDRRRGRLGLVFALTIHVCHAYFYNYPEK